VIVALAVALLYAAASLKGVEVAARLARFALGNLRLIGFLLLLEIVIKVIDHFKFLRDAMNHLPGPIRILVELLGTAGLYLAITRLITLLTGGRGLIGVLGRVSTAVGEEGVAGAIGGLSTAASVALPAALVIGAAALGVFIGHMLRHIPAIRHFGDMVAGAVGNLTGLNAGLTDAQNQRLNQGAQGANLARYRDYYRRLRAAGYSTADALQMAKNAFGFERGGEIGGTSEGRAVRITAHVGEWVLNREQQLRMARLVGGWDSAKRYLFGTPVMRPKSAYALGGQVGSPFGGPRSSGSPVSQTLQIYTSSPDVDIDYVMRIAGARLAGALMP
jgi:hypothetical protein